MNICSHYPFTTRLLLQIYAQGDLPTVATLDIEPEYGVVGRIVYRNGTVRLFRGTNTGINNHGAAAISKDKGYAKYFLTNLGYHTPVGKVFLLPTYADAVAQKLSRYGMNAYARIETVYSYIEQVLGYPCFLKPNDGTGGEGVRKCFSADDVALVVAAYEQDNIPMILAEKAVNLPDYRVVVLRDHVVCCYRRHPLTVVGDGLSSISDLLKHKQEALIQQGRRTSLEMNDARIVATLQRTSRSLNTIPHVGEVVPIHDVSNMSAGGEAEDDTTTIHTHWKDLCIRITADMGLVVCGVDLACADITDPKADYAILEINCSPGLGNYAAMGKEQAARVYELYRMIYQSAP
jgi:D-alanine-D-alanine ligase-like ATP-grasp enzyme